MTNSDIAAKQFDRFQTTETAIKGKRWSSLRVSAIPAHHFPTEPFEMFLSQNDMNRIKESWRLVVPVKETAAELFYKRLFELEPSYRAFFKPDMTSQRAKFIKTLTFIVDSLDWGDAWRDDVETDEDLFLIVLALGRRHSKIYKVPDEGYEVVKEALLFALDLALGKAFGAKTKEAWSRVYNVLAVTMKMGDGSVESGTPGTANSGAEVGAS